MVGNREAWLVHSTAATLAGAALLYNAPANSAGAFQACVGGLLIFVAGLVCTVAPKFTASNARGAMAGLAAAAAASLYGAKLEGSFGAPAHTSVPWVCFAYFAVAAAVQAALVPAGPTGVEVKQKK